MNLKEPNKAFIKEYGVFLKDYLFPVLGIANTGSLYEDVYPTWVEDTIIQSYGKISFGIKWWHLLEVECQQWISEDNIRLAKEILDCFFKTSKYKRTGSAKNQTGFSEAQYCEIYRMAVQRGICKWLIGGRDYPCAEELFSKLEKWSVKTYEGKKVTFGFVINPDVLSNAEEKVDLGNWLDFMEEDHAALLTDCIHSVIELDGNCDFYRYLSISSEDCIPQTSLSEKVPLRFTQVILKYVTGKRIGIFLLNNGDIVLAKHESVCFVRRNLRWLNLSYEAFRNSLEGFAKKSPDISDQLYKSIFASVLDVSFSHAGGIIAVVGGGKWEQSVGDKKILNPCDNLLNGADNETLRQAYLKDESGCVQEELERHSKEIRKRLHKRTMMKKLTGGKVFQKLDRKLRGELIAMDGACILNHAGEVYSFGAIIQNDSGSTGGGRGAAAKKLSTYGMAVKISTDGYIELYVDGEERYAIK
ncbi:MAG: hypothetical protein E7459_09580 [Ruminococcaceae bacterium]|nr:hypothetical protein [Oscillospiraceae bacterium]